MMISIINTFKCNAIFFFYLMVYIFSKLKESIFFLIGG